jgi:hypothetical protein
MARRCKKGQPAPEPAHRTGCGCPDSTDVRKGIPRNGSCICSTCTCSSWTEREGRRDAAYRCSQCILLLRRVRDIQTAATRRQGWCKLSRSKSRGRWAHAHTYTQGHTLTRASHLDGREGFDSLRTSNPRSTVARPPVPGMMGDRAMLIPKQSSTSSQLLIQIKFQQMVRLADSIRTDWMQVRTRQPHTR